MATDRDKELDGLQSELNRPNIEQPDEKTPQQGGLCFLNHHRICGADCVAYAGDQPLPADRCFMLSSAIMIAAQIDVLVPELMKKAKPAKQGPTPQIEPPDIFPRRKQ